MLSIYFEPIIFIKYNKINNKIINFQPFLNHSFLDYYFFVNGTFQINFIKNIFYGCIIRTSILALRAD
jgi:hypothetical protein